MPNSGVPDEGAVALAGKQTQESFTAADTIIEALDLADTEFERIKLHEVYSRNLSTSILTQSLISHNIVLVQPTFWL